MDIVGTDVKHQGQKAGVFLQDGGHHPGQVLHLGSTEAEGLGLPRKVEVLNHGAAHDQSGGGGVNGWSC